MSVCICRRVLRLRANRWACTKAVSVQNLLGMARSKLATVVWVDSANLTRVDRQHQTKDGVDLMLYCTVLVLCMANVFGHGRHSSFIGQIHCLIVGLSLTVRKYWQR
jgi:hypothetical protein